MRLLLFVILCMSFSLHLRAQCTTSAGTTPNYNLEYCQGQTVLFVPPADLVLDSNDVFFYTIHPGNGWNQNVRAVSLNGQFPLTAGFEPEIPFNVSLIVGNPNNGGSWYVDENDPCLSTIILGTLTFHQTPELSCLAEGINCGQPGWQASCDGSEPNYSYQWTGPGFTTTQEEPYLPAAGTYCVTVTSAFGCSAVECITAVFDTIVPELNVYQADPNYCLDTFRLQGYLNTPIFPATVKWTTTGGEILSGTNNFIAMATGNGEYCLTVANPANGCADTACLDIQVWGTPPVADAGPTYQELSCPGGTAQLGGPNTSIGPNFIYDWGCSCNQVPAPVPFPIVTHSGSYHLLVTDTTTGCQAIAVEAFVDAPLYFDFSRPLAVCAGDSTLIVTYIFSDNPPFNIYVGQQGDTLLEFHNVPNTFQFTLPVPAPDTFQIWVNDAAGCGSDTVYSFYIAFDSLEMQFDVAQNGCHPAMVTASYTSNVWNPTALYTWNTGAIGPNIFVTETGWYTLTLLDSYGCSFQDSVYVEIDYSGLCAYLEGTVREDLLENCSPDSGELPLQGWLVEANDGNTVYYGTTDANGYYNIPAEPGNYTVSLSPPNALWGVCANDIAVSLPAPDDSITVDFLAYAIPECPLLTVDVSTPFLRRCFGGNIYHINYCNEGTGPATGAYVLLTFDPFLSLDQATIPFSNLGNNVYRFEVGDLAVGACGSFSTSMTVSCTALPGQTHCTEAHIFPDTLCLDTNPLWSGASLQVEAECSDSLRFRIKNTGYSPMTAPLEYVVIEDIVMYMNAPPPSIMLGIDESFELVVPANGSTWRVEVEQEAYHPAPSYPVLAVEGCGANSAGNFSTGFVNQFPLGDPEPFLDLDCTENIGGCDPNGKYAYPSGVGSQHIIEQNRDIEYIIRFQNTGTDTAFNVVIRDTLSPFFDIRSLKPGAASHPYEFEVYSTGVLKFSFPNIQLPDSSVNEPGSNGYVTYRVAQKPNVPLGTVLENSAAIYFDFNAPVITNTVFHTLGENFLLSNTAVNPQEKGRLSVSPNPTADVALFEISGTLPDHALFRLSDAFGRRVQEAPFSGNAFRFDRENLPAGVYYYVVENAGQAWYTGKIVLK